MSDASGVIDPKIPTWEAGVGLDDDSMLPPSGSTPTITQEMEFVADNEGKTIIERNTRGASLSASNVITSSDIIRIQAFNQKIYADEKIIEYVTDIVDATRYPEAHGLDISDMIEYGASPRASIWMILASKAHALLNGRGYVVPEDVVHIANDVLRHRIILTYEAEAEGVTSDNIIRKVLSSTRSP